MTKALIPSVVRDEPQIYPSRSADVSEETEGMSTTTEERGDLLIRTSLSTSNSLHSGRAHHDS